MIGANVADITDFVIVGILLIGIVVSRTIIFGTHAAGIARVTVTICIAVNAIGIKKDPNAIAILIEGCDINISIVVKVGSKY
jgi:hypothetical protein